MVRRLVIFNKVLGRTPTDKNILEAGINELMRDYNQRREFSLDVLDSLSVQIAKWLR
jgi:hypothetical protein